jgi:signal transduction histidine kinase/ligand-binding sensor domain-containing protein
LLLSSIALAGSSVGAEETAGERAQKPVEFGQYFCDAFGKDLGLPQSNVLAVRQTRDGALWVGAEGGLARFDGVRFVAFRTSNTPAFLNHLVHCLYEDREGTLWIGTDRGLVRRRRGKFEHMGLADVSVRAIVEDRAGRLWIGTGGRGLFAWRNEQLVSTAVELPLPSKWILSLSVDLGDRLWVGFGDINGAVCCDRGTVERFDGAGAIDSVVHAVCEYPRGTWWFGTHNRGLFRRDASGVRQFRTRDGLSTMGIAQLLPARGGGMWIVGGSLQKLTGPGEFSVVTVSPLSTHNVENICEDHEGNVWLGAKSDGLLRVRHMPYRWITTAEGLPGNAIKTVAEDKTGTLWLGIQRGGIARLEPNGRVERLRDEELPPGALDNPASVYPAPDGSVWCGGVILTRWQAGRLHSFPEYRGVRGLFVDRRGVVWISTGSNGLMRYVDGVFTPVTFPDGRRIPYVASFADGPDGAVYLGTWGEGVLCWQNGTVTVDNQESGLPSNEVRALYVDTEARLWAGFRSRGLALKLDGRWRNPPAVSEAVADHVSGIAQDEHGRLWLGTADGVMWAPMAEIVAALKGEMAPHLHLVEMAGGVQSTGVWPGSMPVIWKARDGRLLFATRTGLLALDPDNLPVNRAPPPVRIEAMLADRHALDLGAPIVISARTRNLAIDYTAFSFVQPHRVVFKYKLDGYDADWVDAGTRRTAFYTNLPARDYVFRVVAGNSDGIWNEAGARMAFVVQPLWWQTWWFRLGGLVAFTAAVGAVARSISVRRLRSRMRELEQQAALDRERARIARDLHDDLGTRLTNIVLVSGLAQRDRMQPELVATRLDQVITGTRQVIQSLSQAVWAINPRNDTLRDLFDYISYFAVEFLQAANIRCRVDLFGGVPQHVIKSDVRHNVFLAVKEVLHNVVRHSKATEAWLRVDVTGPLFSLTIEDNGHGFPPGAEPPRGNGLRNIRQRLADVGGTLKIDDRPGGGTRVELQFPSLPS